MIRPHYAIGLACVVVLAIGCRDAPTAPPTAASLSASMSDTVDELPPEARILSAYTEVGFYDGGHGGEAVAEFKVGMEYIGNKATMSTRYTITGEGLNLSDRINNAQDAFYDLRPIKKFDEIYYVPPNRTCGIVIDAQTQHQAWWWVYFRWVPQWESPRATRNTFAPPYHVEACREEQEGLPEEEGGGDGSGDGGGSGALWITIETCHYWAHYVGGVLVSTELRYCEFDTIPVADQ